MAISSTAAANMDPKTIPTTVPLFFLLPSSPNGGKRTARRKNISYLILRKQKERQEQSKLLALLYDSIYFEER